MQNLVKQCNRLACRKSFGPSATTASPSYAECCIKVGRLQTLGRNLEFQAFVYSTLSCKMNASATSE